MVTVVISHALLYRFAHSNNKNVIAKLSMKVIESIYGLWLNQRSVFAIETPLVKLQKWMNTKRNRNRQMHYTKEAN